MEKTVLYLTLPIRLHRLTLVFLVAFWSIWAVLCMKAYMIRNHPMPMKMASARILWARYAG